MSDDLVKRLLEPCFERGLDELWIDAQRKEAADRIEELEANLTEVEKDAKRADAIWSDNYEALKAKLATAVQLIDDIFSDHGMDECVCEVCTSYVERRAELTGGKNE